MEPSVIATSAARRRGRPPKSNRPTPVATKFPLTKLTINVADDCGTRLRTAAARYRLTVSQLVERLAAVIPPSGELPGHLLP
jgi:hypothetical protein